MFCGLSLSPSVAVTWGSNINCKFIVNAFAVSGECSFRIHNSEVRCYIRRERAIYPEHAFRQSPVVLLGNLCPVIWSLEDGRVVVYVLHVNYNRCVILLQVIRGSKPKLVLQKGTRANFIVKVCVFYISNITYRKIINQIAITFLSLHYIEIIFNYN